MFGFFKEVNIQQGGDCYGMWLILRGKGGKYWSPSGISSLLGGQNNRLGVQGLPPRSTVRYGIFSNKGIFVIW